MQGSKEDDWELYPHAQESLEQFLSKLRQSRIVSFTEATNCARLLKALFANDPLAYLNLPDVRHMHNIKHVIAPSTGKVRLLFACDHRPNQKLIYVAVQAPTADTLLANEIPLLGLVALHNLKDFRFIFCSEGLSAYVAMEAVKRMLEQSNTKTVHCVCFGVPGVESRSITCLPTVDDTIGKLVGCVPDKSWMDATTLWDRHPFVATLEGTYAGILQGGDLPFSYDRVVRVMLKGEGFGFLRVTGNKLTVSSAQFVVRTELHSDDCMILDLVMRGLGQIPCRVYGLPLSSVMPSTASCKCPFPDASMPIQIFPSWFAGRRWHIQNCSFTSLMASAVTSSSLSVGANGNIPDGLFEAIDALYTFLLEEYFPRKDLFNVLQSYIALRGLDEHVASVVDMVIKGTSGTTLTAALDGLKTSAELSDADIERASVPNLAALFSEAFEACRGNKPFDGGSLLHALSFTEVMLTIAFSTPDHIRRQHRGEGVAFCTAIVASAVFGAELAWLSLCAMAVYRGKSIAAPFGYLSLLFGKQSAALTEATFLSKLVDCPESSMIRRKRSNSVGGTGSSASSTSSTSSLLQHNLWNLEEFAVRQLSERNWGDFSWPSDLLSSIASVSSELRKDMREHILRWLVPLHDLRTHVCENRPCSIGFIGRAKSGRTSLLSSLYPTLVPADAIQETQCVSIYPVADGLFVVDFPTFQQDSVDLLIRSAECDVVFYTISLQDIIDQLPDPEESLLQVTSSNRPFLIVATHVNQAFAKLVEEFRSSTPGIPADEALSRARTKAEASINAAIDLFCETRKLVRHCVVLCDSLHFEVRHAVPHGMLVSPSQLFAWLRRVVESEGVATALHVPPAPVPADMTDA
jgi:hypothetical protein